MLDQWMKELLAGTEYYILGTFNGCLHVGVLANAAFAKRALARNQRNRPWNRGRSTKLAANMLNGEWEYTGNGPKFSASSDMIDGQHTCNGVIIADKSSTGIAVPLLVIFNMPEAALYTVDTDEAGRSLGDRWGIEGVLQSTAVAAATRTVFAVLHGSVTSASIDGRQPTHGELTAVRRAVPYLHEGINLARTKNGDKVLSRPSLMGGLFAMMLQADRAKALAFIESVIDGANISKDSPELTLRNHLISVKEAAGPKTTASAKDIVPYTLAAWRACFEGRSLSKMYSTKRISVAGFKPSAELLAAAKVSRKLDEATEAAEDGRAA